MTEAGSSNGNGNRQQILDSINPALKITTKPFNGFNYLMWAKSAKLSLSGKSKLGHVTGSKPRPPAGDPKLEEWESSDHTVYNQKMNNFEVSETTTSSQRETTSSRQTRGGSNGRRETTSSRKTRGGSSGRRETSSRNRQRQEGDEQLQ
ncbi:hypothetical protein EJ110_NYTH54949 [Nymphaea thermarum]|nr:hypothetical protein EJ110_NYTH54949 [Nymphaea thermarum]